MCHTYIFWHAFIHKTTVKKLHDQAEEEFKFDASEKSVELCMCSIILLYIDSADVDTLCNDADTLQFKNRKLLTFYSSKSRTSTELLTVINV